MCHQHAIPHKRQKLGQNHINGRCIGHHGVINARQFCNFGRDGHLGVYKRGKPVHNVPAGHLYSPDFRNLVPLSGKTRGFDVKDHKVVVNALPLGTNHRRPQVVHQIAFHAIQNFDVLAIGGFHGFGEGLHHAVVGDGNGAVAPA